MAQRQFAAPFFVGPDLPAVVNGADLISSPRRRLPTNTWQRAWRGNWSMVSDMLLNPGHTGGSLHFANMLRVLWLQGKN